MQRLPVGVAFVADEPTAEQRQALSWCERTVDTVETVAPETLDAASLTEYDAVWWHCATDPAPPETDAVREYVGGGGGLLLTLRAMETVDTLGIDPIRPDATGHEEIAAPAGFARRSIHDDHPLFEDLSDRFHTRLARGGHQAFARYERVLPARGDVLACDVRGEDRLAARKTAIGWHPGEGYVLGVGDALAFDVEGGVETANGARLVRNALAVLGGRRPTFTGRPDDAAGMQALRERLADDHHRPRYHVSPPANWLNDPNGLIHHEGRFHVFYQYNPGGPFHNAIHWGHAVSDDLIHWRDEPVALAPGPDGPDRDGCWSGCAVRDRGEVRFLYTGGRDRVQLPCMATATDDSLRVLEKYSDNPIIEEAPDDPAILETDDWSAEFRDHCVWRGDDCWYQVIGSGVQGEGGTVLLYRAEDLTEWEYVGPLLVGQDGDGTVWECPELFEFGSEDLLQVSNYDVTRYFVGRADYDEPSFTVESEGLIDYGDFYAPQSMHTEDGRVLMWGWLQEVRDPDAQWEAGWSGLLSLPRELDCDDGLVQRPARELAGLRERHAHEGEHALAAGQHRALDAPGDGCEIRARIDPEPGTVVELGVRESPALTERTVVRYDAEAGELAVDRRESSHDGRAARDVQVAPVEADAGDPLDLHVFVDGSVVELFADEHTCLTGRIYPTREDATGLSVAARDGAADVVLDVWELGSSWATGR